MICIGVDPGLNRMGFAVMDVDFEKESPILKNIKVVSFGLLTTPNNVILSRRLKILYDDLLVLFEKYKPQCVIVEDLFFTKNVTSGLQVSAVRGILLLVLEIMQIPYISIHPSVLKKRLTHYGKAKKTQIVSAVCALFDIPKQNLQTDDVADAIAILYAGLLEINLKNLYDKQTGKINVGEYNRNKANNFCLKKKDMQKKKFLRFLKQKKLVE